MSAMCGTKASESAAPSGRLLLLGLFPGLKPLAEYPLGQKPGAERNPSLWETKAPALNEFRSLWNRAPPLSESLLRYGNPRLSGPGPMG
jgi:hypothetical protein